MYGQGNTIVFFNYFLRNICVGRFLISWLALHPPLLSLDVSNTGDMYLHILQDIRIHVIASMDIQFFREVIPLIVKV